jgi:hypothetical protein
MLWRRPTLAANECALVVAIPLDRDEFSADAEAQTDFLREYCATARAYGRDPWIAYAHHAQRYRDVIAAVEDLGVAVTRRATMARLAEAVARYNVVTLVAHSRGPGIDARDIVDVVAIVERGPAIAARCEGAGEPPARDADATCVAAWLDAALGPSDISDRDAVPETRAFAWRVALYNERWTRRRAIEALCPNALRGGPSIEFHDGLAPIDDVSAALPRQLRTLDLTVCDSVLLAERVRAGRRGGVILANPRPATADFRLALYRETIRLMARQRTGYQETAIRLRRQLRH